VLVTAGALLVPVAVMVRFELPTICVNSFVFVVRVICEFEVAEAVPFSELRVRVRSPETKMRGPVLVTVLWPESVTYVNFEPIKSVTGMVVLIVDRSEFVNSKAVYSALLEELVLEDEDDEDDDDEEPVSVAVVETPVPVPVSSCALAPRAARHSTHTCRDNMIVPPMLEMSSGRMRRARVSGQGSGLEADGGRRVSSGVNGRMRWDGVRSTESTGRLRRAGDDGSTTALIPTESRGSMQTLAVFSLPRPVLAA